MQLSDWFRTTKVSQKDFAAAVGVTRAYVSLLAKGESIPSLPVAWRIDDATLGAVGPNDWKVSYAARKSNPRVRWADPNQLELIA